MRIRYKEVFTRQSTLAMKKAEIRINQETKKEAAQGRPSVDLGQTGRQQRGRALGCWHLSPWWSLRGTVMENRLSGHTRC